VKMTLMAVMMMVTSVLFVGVMLRMQYVAFADRATRALLSSAAFSPPPTAFAVSLGDDRSSARALP
jgi:hypothetical protein